MSTDQTADSQPASTANPDPVPADTEAKAEAKAPTESVEEFPHKVFVGNVAFATTEEELKEFFTPVGKVCEAKIITRGTRSLGYGFVAFETPEECEEAVDKLSKKELGGREINVEVAKPQSTEPKLRKPRGRHPPRRTRRNDPESDDGELITHAEAGAVGNANGGSEKHGPRRKNLPRRKGAPGGGKKPFVPRRERLPQGEPSKTAVFVANLPFSMDDNGLFEVFNGYKVKTASVVLRKGSGRSKGFGFVDFESEAEQQRLLSSEDKLVADGRELSVKVALRDEGPAEASEGGTPKEESTPSAAAAVPAPDEKIEA